MKGLLSLVFLGILGLSICPGTSLGSESGQAPAVESEGPKLINEGHKLMLECNFTTEAGNDEQPSNNGEILLDWFKDDEPIDVSQEKFKRFTIHNNLTLVIDESVRTDAGDYKCQPKGSTETAKTIKVIYVSFKKMDKSLAVTEGELIEMECKAEGIPEPIINWYKDNVNIVDLFKNETTRVYKLIPNNMKIPHPNGTLQIYNAQYSDRGNYTCVIDTDYKDDLITYSYLRVKDKYAALWPFIGIVIEVVILGIIIIIFEKRRAKAEFDESDTDPGNDQKNRGGFKDARRK